MVRLEPGAGERAWVLPVAEPSAVVVWSAAEVDYEAA